MNQDIPTSEIQPNWQPTACILCSRNCGIEVQIKEGQIAKVRGDKKHPISQGYLCQKAMGLNYYQNNSDRLTSPLKRKDDGSFEPISWDQAIQEIADKLLKLRTQHGGRSLAYYGGAGQGNHLGATYAVSMRAALHSRYFYQALAQEKTGDAWINQQLFGREVCHISEDIENSDYIIFIGTNPWQAHGIPNARKLLKEIAKDPQKTMVVIDPVRTETAELANFHLQLVPGTDAFLLSAILGVIFQEGLENRPFLEAHTTGFEEVQKMFLKIPIDAFCQKSGIDLATVRQVARGLAAAQSACVRVDLGIQQSLHSTLNSYLEKLLFLVTGNFAKKGGNNLHTWLVPIAGYSDFSNPQRKPSWLEKIKHRFRGLTEEGRLMDLTDPPNAWHQPWKTVVTEVAEIGKLFPPNVLPQEIDTDHPQRTRGLIVDSANPVLSGADSQAYEAAFKKLELLVVVDVAMTETARLAHYVLPAASQFEKWETTFFTLAFPTQAIHLRKPCLSPTPGTLPEPEIYDRLLVAMGEIPKKFPILETIARLDRFLPVPLFPLALAVAGIFRPKLLPYIGFVLRKTIGKTLPESADAAAPLWATAQIYASRHKKAVRRTGIKGWGVKLGHLLFKKIISNHSGTLISVHVYEDTWKLIYHPDRKIHLDIPEMARELQSLNQKLQTETTDPQFPFILIAGERRAYNANTIYRDPRWRKEDPYGFLRIHPRDAQNLGLLEDSWASCESKRGTIRVRVRHCDRIRPGVVSLPNGYATRLLKEPEEFATQYSFPNLNWLTASDDRDPISATPYHKYVRVNLRPNGN